MIICWLFKRLKNMGKKNMRLTNNAADECTVVVADAPQKRNKDTEKPLYLNRI
jgi:hypothetical protein